MTPGESIAKLRAEVGPRVSTTDAERLGVPRRHLHDAVLRGMAKLERVNTETDVAIYVILS